MAIGSFEKLSKKLNAAQQTEIALPDNLSDILADHLDVIAAAHHSNHVNDHHSHPNVNEVGG